MASFRLRFLDRAVALAAGELVIGRAATVQIRVDHPLVSRRHARLRISDDGVVIEDLGSRNGVLVNGDLLRGPRLLEDGDTIRIGEVDFTVQAAASPGAAAPTVRIDIAEAPGTEPDMQVSTAPSSLLLDMADKSISLGRSEDADWILTKLREDIEARLASGQKVGNDTLERLSTIGIARDLARSEGTWIDWIFRVHTLATRVLSATVIDALHPAIRKLRHPATGAMTRYVDAMRRLAPTLSPADRFNVGRLEGLLEVAARNAG